MPFFGPGKIRQDFRKKWGGASGRDGLRILSGNVMDAKTMMLAALKSLRGAQNRPRKFPPL